MEIAEAQLAAIRAWRLQLWRCAFLAVVCPVMFYLSRQIGVRAVHDIAPFCIIVMSYAAEQTFHAWRQLRFARNLIEPLTALQVRQNKANEAWRNSIRDCVVGFAFLMYLAAMLWSSNRKMTSVLWLTFPIVLVLLGVGLTRSWRGVRRVNA